MEKNSIAQKKIKSHIELNKDGKEFYSIENYLSYKIKSHIELNKELP